MIKTFIFLFFLGFHPIGSAQTQAPTDPTKSLECMITTDFYIVHLSSYQEPKKTDSKKRHRFKPFCQVLPEHGPSFLSLDFIDRDLRQMPIGMQVIELKEDPEGKEMIDGAIIAESPAQNYKTGVAQIQVNFPKPGHYALIASVGDDMFADKIRIPLRVGIGSEFNWSSLLPYLMAVLVAFIAYGIYRFFIYRHKRKTANQNTID
jgi:hypothetical protein